MVDPDVIVVGAGAAGLAATHTLAERGLSVIALEARDRQALGLNAPPEGLYFVEAIYA